MTPTFRRARSEDAERVFEWANDPAARAASFNSAKINYEDHVAWFEESLSRPDRHLLIATEESEAVAVVRFDGKGPRGTISINVGPDHRGRGLGPAILLAASHQAVRIGYTEILAQIRPENTASVRAFEKAGYTPLPDCAVNGQRALQLLKVL